MSSITKISDKIEPQKEISLISRFFLSLIQIIEKWGCGHKWAHERTVRVSDEWGGTYSVFHYHCSKRGKMRKVKSY